MHISHVKCAGLVAIATAAVFSSHLTAASQERPPCSEDVKEIIGLLQEDWGEEVIAIGLNSNEHVVQWLTNKETGTWSEVVSMPNGAGCLTSSGKHFDMVLLPVGDPS